MLMKVYTLSAISVWQYVGLSPTLTFYLWVLRLRWRCLNLMILKSKKQERIHNKLRLRKIQREKLINFYFLEFRCEGQ